jgi:hypothetical protein
LRENVDQMLEIFLTNESNKNLRHFSLKGLYSLLSFVELVEKAKLVDSSFRNNFEVICKRLWHSIWLFEHGVDISEDKFEQI